jgi:hypothetical protein
LYYGVNMVLQKFMREHFELEYLPNGPAGPDVYRMHDSNMNFSCMILMVVKTAERNICYRYRGFDTIIDSPTDMLFRKHANHVFDEMLTECAANESALATARAHADVHKRAADTAAAADNATQAASVAATFALTAAQTRDDAIADDVEDYHVDLTTMAAHEAAIAATAAANSAAIATARAAMAGAVAHALSSDTARDAVISNARDAEDVLSNARAHLFRVASNTNCSPALYHAALDAVAEATTRANSTMTILDAVYAANVYIEPIHAKHVDTTYRDPRF